MAKASVAKSEAKTDAVCGIIMPISAMPPEYDAAHWADVRKVLDEAVIRAGLTPQIVSDSFETDVIQKRIVHNLYSNPVVICDVSGLNPNVMFELGMRLTFKKPVVIVTDNVGQIPFDTSVIEHFPYPRDLHIHKTNEFVENLSEKIGSLLEQSSRGTFKPYLEAFGTFEVFQPSSETVTADTYIAERLDDLIRSVRSLERRAKVQDQVFSSNALGDYGRPIFIRNVPSKYAEDIVRTVSAMRGVLDVELQSRGKDLVMLVRIEPLAPSGTESRIDTLIRSVPKPDENPRPAA